MSEQHEMILETTHPSGAEEWYCPICGRRFLIQWQPVFEKIALEAGDAVATHAGGNGGLAIGAIQVEAEEETLEPFREWMDGIDFDALLGKE